MVAGVENYRGCRIKWNLTCIFVYPGATATIVYPADSAGTLTAEPVPDSAEFLASEDKARESVLKKAREWIDRE